MGERSRKRRARRAWLVPLVMPLIRALTDRVRKARPRAAYRLAMVLGTLFRWTRFTRGTIRRNLALACGGEPGPEELRRFERAYYDHFALLLVEFLRQPAIGRGDLDLFEQTGLKQAKELYDAGEGLILVTGHVGVWELAIHAAGLFGIPVEAIAKQSGYAQIDEYVEGIRGASGVAGTRDSKGSLWGIKKALDRGQAIGILVDQEVRQGMIFAPFFGIPAATSSGPAMLHLRTKAPIAVVTVQREAPFRYSTHVEEVIRHEKTDDREADMLAVTTRINASLEAALRRHPEQWLWSHRRWRRRPEGEAEPFGRVIAASELKV